MIPTIYLRSSSINTWSNYCQMDYYLTYGLGYTQKPNRKTEMGTIYHKVMECLAKIKLAIQQGKNYIEDDVIGLFYFDEKDVYKVTYLSDKKVESINKHRSYSGTYKWNCILKDNKRIGEELVKVLLDKSYNHYQSRSENEWGTFDKYTIENWIFITKEYNDGEYDPTKLNIIQPEQNFNFTIEKDWAYYKYDLGDRELEGYLSIQGTIDLIYEIDGTKCVNDWKTGRRINWSTSKEKTYDSLIKDTQLRLYYYSIYKLLNEHAIINIFYVRDGGPTTLNFDHTTLEEIEDKIREVFEQLKNCQKPLPRSEDRSHIHCYEWCTHFKNKLKGDSMNLCRRIESDINLNGIDWVNKNRRNPKHDFKYQNPGE